MTPEENNFEGTISAVAFEKNGITITVTNAVPSQIARLKKALDEMDLSKSSDPQ